MPKLGWSPPKTVQVFHADCREYLKQPSKEDFDFIFADPPFNIGQKYKGFKDSMSWSEYREFTLEWISLCWKRCKGVMALHGNDQLVFEYHDYMRQYQGTRIAWVNWHYRFGQCNRSNWIDSRCHCLIYAKDPPGHTWNPEEVLVPSDRATTYGDKRINETENGGMRVPFTVWGIPSDGPNWGRVQGNNRERRPGHPNQLPEAYLTRLIKAYTNPGDLVYDPFAGSGTTVVVAKKLGRRCITTDISLENVRSVQERLKEAG